MRSEREKMRAGELYDPHDTELVRQRELLKLEESNSDLLGVQTLCSTSWRLLSSSVPIWEGPQRPGTSPCSAPARPRAVSAVAQNYRRIASSPPCVVRVLPHASLYFRF